MRVGKVRSRRDPHVHCARSVRKVLLRKSRRIGCLKANRQSKQKSFSHRGWVVTLQEGDVVSENGERRRVGDRFTEFVWKREKEGEWVTGLLSLSELVF